LSAVTFRYQLRLCCGVSYRGVAAERVIGSPAVGLALAGAFPDCVCPASRVARLRTP